MWAHSSLMARAALRCFRARTRILDIDNLAALDARRAVATTDGTLPQRLLRRIDAAAIGREERRRIASFPDVVLCSERERRLLGNVPGRVQVVPNAVPGPDRPYGLGPDPTLLFVGFLGYDVNVDALQPLVGTSSPGSAGNGADARLVVAGLSPQPTQFARSRNPRSTSWPTRRVWSRCTAPHASSSLRSAKAAALGSRCSRLWLAVSP